MQLHCKKYPPKKVTKHQKQWNYIWKSGGKKISDEDIFKEESKEDQEIIKKFDTEKGDLPR